MSLLVRPWFILDALLTQQTAQGVHKFRVPGCPVNKLWRVLLHIFSIINAPFFLTYKNMYQFTSTKKKAPDNSEVHMSLQNCGSSVWCCLHVTILMPRIFRQFLDFWKIYWPQGYTSKLAEDYKKKSKIVLNLKNHKINIMEQINIKTMC